MDKAVARGQEQQIRLNPLAPIIMGIDPGFGGSSAFGITIVQMVSVKPENPTNSMVNSNDSGTVIQVLYSEDFQKPDFNAMIAVIRNLVIKYNLVREGSQIYIDGSAAAFIRSLKLAIGDNPDYEGVIARAKGFRRVPPHWLGLVVPVAFSTEHKRMLWHLKVLMDNNYIAIKPEQTKLITSLKSAWEENGSLDKTRTLHSDLFDSLRLCTRHFELGTEK